MNLIENLDRLRRKIELLEKSLSALKFAVYFLLSQYLLLAIWAVAEIFRK